MQARMASADSRFRSANDADRPRFTDSPPRSGSGRDGMNEILRPPKDSPSPQGSLKIPSMSSLRAFVKTAELRSFSRAADALGVTHSAVIHQVRALEASLGEVLLEKGVGKVQLTDAGSQLFMQVVGQVRDLERIFIGDHTLLRRRTLTVDVMSSFAQGWMIKNLDKISDYLEGVRIDLRLCFTLDDKVSDDSDITIRYGSGPWPGLESSLLCEDFCFPVVAPTYGKLRSLREIKDLGRADLIENPHSPWRNWFQVVGIAHGELRINHTIADSYTCQKLAEGGGGIALGRRSICTEALRSGRLLRLFDPAQVQSVGLWILWRPSSGRSFLATRLASKLQDLLNQQ
jgi:LysR family glycine cleavage system transcriptional activator